MLPRLRNFHALFLILCLLATQTAGANGRKLLVGAGFQPNQISGVVLDLDADDLSTVTKDGSNKVSHWLDKSSNLLDFAQATSANQPTWTANVINGRAAMRFFLGGTQTCLIGPSINLVSPTQAFEIYVVSQINAFSGSFPASDYPTIINFQTASASTAPNYAYSKDPAVKDLQWGAGSGNWSPGVRHTLSPVTGVFHALRMSFTGSGSSTSSYSATADGSAATLSAGASGSADNTNIIGANTASNCNFGLDGYISRMVLFNRQLNTGERNLMNNYIHARYGL